MNKKTFAFVLAAAVLGLAACGNPTPDTSAKGSAKASTPAASKTSRSLTSRAPVKSASITSVEITEKQNKVYLVLNGTASNLQATDLKMAFGLMEVGSARDAVTNPDTGEVTSPATPAVWAVGKESPADADYTYSPTLENNALKLEVCLSDITTFNGPAYTIYAGIKGYFDYSYLSDMQEANAKADAKYRYHTRSDYTGSSGLALVVTELSPVALTEAVVFEENDKLYVKIGGETEKTLDQLKAYNSYLNFQRTQAWTDTRVYQKDDNPQEGRYYYEWILDGTKAYIKADISFFVAGARYNTHLNVTQSTSADCVMKVDINQDYTFTERNLKITVVSDTSKGQADGEPYFWGHLGFITEALEETPAA